MLNKYLSFVEKENSNIDIIKINNEENWNQFYLQLLNDSITEQFLWRGLKDASSKLYNSCQRYYERIFNNEENEQYFELIQNLVDYIYNWNNGTVIRYLESQEIQNDVVAVMTLMQHYNYPTPLLDFSSNPLISLYFATEDTLYSSDENDIRNYSVLYSLDSKFQNLQEFNKAYNINNRAYEDQFTPLFSTKLLVITRESDEFKIGTSLNIINQAGAFIYSNDPCMPLEDVLNLEAVNGHSQIKSWHIHKKLNQSIRLVLDREHSINQDFLFPNLYNMIKDFHAGK